MLNGFEYEHWLAAARRVARQQSEAGDLLHDSLMEAMRAGRTNFADESNRRWFAGVLKNRAKMDARSALRRTKREQARTTRDHVVTGVTTPREFIETLPRAARHSLLRPNPTRLKSDLHWIASSGARVLASTEPDYPQQLLDLPDAPAILFVLGDVRALPRKQVAIVGSRKATRDGRRTARRFGRSFVQAGLTVTSGLALGSTDSGFTLAGLTPPGESTFLGLATVDSSTGQLVPGIRAISIKAGLPGHGAVGLDNFTERLPGRLPATGKPSHLSGASGMP